MGTRHEQIFLQIRHRWPIDMKRCSASLINRQIQIKSTPVRMAKIKKTRNNKRWCRCGKKGTLVHCWWEWKLVQPLWKTVWKFLKKLKIELPYDPVILPLCIYPKNMKTLIWKDIFTPYVYCSIIYNSPNMEATQVPKDRWMDKEVVCVCVCVYIYILYI